MKTLMFTFLALVSSAASAPPTSQDFRIELFSHRMVKSLTLQGMENSIKLCGIKADGPCWVLPSSERVSCTADRSVHCRYQGADRSFTLLMVDSAAPFHLDPTFANGDERVQSFMTRSAQILASSAGLQVITRMDLESYVSAVIRGEASILQAPAARQAMAILARTWAVRWQGRHRARGFDFCSLTHCQVFRLASAEDGKSGKGLDAAAAATRGEVLLYRSKLADPYFTASCGGMTEAAGSVWPDRARPYLVSLRDPNCLGSSHATWSQTLSAVSLQQVLRDSLGLPIKGQVTELAIEKRDSSGRATVLRAAAGSVWDIDANEFRYAVDRRLGWQQIKSNRYSIARRGDSWVFSGHGLGHGVGLCQVGAEQMARMGFSTEHILNIYFPGTEIGGHPAADADPIASSEHFELIYFSSQEPWVKHTLDTLEQWRKELGTHADILRGRVRVQTWSNVGDFIRATGEPGWMAAASDGSSITLQPLDLLGRKRILSQTLRHEVTHLVVHRHAAKGVPRWYEEGLVLYLTGERIDSAPGGFDIGRDLEEAITKPRSEAEMKAAYAQALGRVRHLAMSRGDPALWGILQQPGPDDLRWLHSTS